MSQNRILKQRAAASAMVYLYLLLLLFSGAMAAAQAARPDPAYATNITVYAKTPNRGPS